MKTKMTEKIKKSVLRLPITEPIKKMGMMHSAGCRMDEMKTPLRSANDVVEKTNKRRMRATEKPKRKSLTQTLGFLRKTLTRLPRKMKPNHVRQEKRERAEQRLKLKTGSLLIKTRWMMKSASEATEKKTVPKIKPKARPKEVGRNRKIVRRPPSTHKTQSQTTIFLWEGSVKRDE